MDTASEIAGSHETRERVLQAAGEIFAEHGFAASRVREICQRAGANIASINYYFGDKESLYRQVLHLACEFVLEKYPVDEGLQPGATPSQHLQAFVRSYLRRMFDQDRPCWHGKVMMREMLEPTIALDEIVERLVRPQFQVLAGIVRDLGGGALSDQDIRLCCESIIGQCVYYRQAKSILHRLRPGAGYGPGDVDLLSGHVARFSLAAIEELASQRRAAK